MDRAVDLTRAREHRPPATRCVRDTPPPYEPPALAVYGPVAELTGSVGTRGKRDGARRRRTGF